MGKKVHQSKAIRILRAATREQWITLIDKLSEINAPVTSEWLVSHGFPDDLDRAVKIAIAELGDFCTSQDVDEFPVDNIRQLLQTCVDRRQWLMKINKPPVSASSADQERLRFYDEQKAARPQARYKQIADLWNRQFDDCCDEQAFRQSCYRARKRNT